MARQGGAEFAAPQDGLRGAVGGSVNAKCLSVAFGVAAGVGATGAAYAVVLTVEVPAIAAIWLAQQPAGTVVQGSDLAPTNSPVAVNLSAFDATVPLLFRVTGTTSRDPNLQDYPLVGPDGETPGTGPRASNITIGEIGVGVPVPTNIQGMTGPFSSLVGVFLPTSQFGATPGLLDFGTASKRAFTRLTPEVQQVFFIGDGLTEVGVGTRQLFDIPTSAGELYLGLFDGGNGNNVGSLTVTVCSLYDRYLVPPDRVDRSGVRKSPSDDLKRSV